MTLVDVDVQQLRRELVSETGIRIDDDDPTLLSATISARITNRIIATEREKRADENLPTYKDVRHVLMEVRDDALHASEDLAAVAVTRVAEKVIEQVASAGVKYAAALYSAKASILFGTEITPRSSARSGTVLDYRKSSSARKSEPDRDRSPAIWERLQHHLQHASPHTTDTYLRESDRVAMEIGQLIGAHIERLVKQA